MRGRTTVLSWLLAGLLLAAAGLPAAPGRPAQDRVAEGFRAIQQETGGTLGVVARHLTQPRAFEHLPDEVFPGASVIKLHLLTALYRAAEREELSLADTITLRDEDKVGGSGRLQRELAGTEYTLAELARLMIVISDNTATNLLLNRLGGMVRVNEDLRRLGITRSRFNRYMMDTDAQQRGVENDLTPRETADLLTALERRTAAEKPETSQAILDVLLAQELRNRMPALLPDGTRVAHKTGSLDGVAHDAGIIYAPSGPIVLVVLTKGIPDRAVAERAIQRLAKLVYDEWGGER